MTFIAYASILIALLSTILAIGGKHQFYWMAAVSIYVFSFLAGFSIGQLTVGITFIFIVLALGYSFKWIKSEMHLIVFIIIGFIIGYLMITFVDDYWLFYPFTFVLH